MLFLSPHRQHTAHIHILAHTGIIAELWRERKPGGAQPPAPPAPGGGVGPTTPPPPQQQGKRQLYAHVRYPGDGDREDIEVELVSLWVE